MTRHRQADAAALLGFVLIAFLYFGIALLTGSERRYLGTASDPQIFIWSFAWWPHAILNGINPFVTHAIWAPSGLNLTWTTTVPGLALLLSPVTLLFGPLASYDVAAVLMPALAAWTGFLLCRRLTRMLWPSLAAGYLFGFSSYVLGQETSHLHMSSVFLVPLIALVIVRWWDGELDTRGLVVRLGPLLALQLLFSTELSLTIALALGGAVVVAWLVDRAGRSRAVASIRPLAASYAFAGLLTAPFLYYLAAGLHTGSYTLPSSFVGDLVNFVVPTQVQLISRLTHATSLSNRFPGNYSENGSFLGPTLLIVAWFARDSWRTVKGRFLLVSIGITALATLGEKLTVLGHGVIPLPWDLVAHLPFFDNILTDRLSLFTSLAAAVIVAFWAAARTDRWRWILPLVAIAAILPDPWVGLWSTDYAAPAFFTQAAYRGCLGQNENVLPVPEGISSRANLWQAEDAFRFRIAGGRVATTPPTEFMHPTPIEQISTGQPVTLADIGTIHAFIQAKDVTSVVVDPALAPDWVPVMDRIAIGHAVGGVRVYYFAGSSPHGCPAS